MTEEAAYTMQLSRLPEADLLRVGFGPPAKGDRVVRAAVEAFERAAPPGGRLLKINGPISIAAAMMLAHRVAHLYGAVAVFDPRLAGYIVAISHDPEFELGQVLPEAIESDYKQS